MERLSSSQKKVSLNRVLSLYVNNPAYMYFLNAKFGSVLFYFTESSFPSPYRSVILYSKGKDAVEGSALVERALYASVVRMYVTCFSLT